MIPHIVMPVPAERKKEYPSNHFMAYALGWVLEDYRGRLIIWHNGGIDGMLSHQGFLPEENLGVVVLTNSDRSRLDAALFYRIVDAFLGEPVKDWSQIFLTQAKEGEAKAEEARKKAEESRVPNTQPSLDLAGYCGAYENEMYGTAEVKKEADKLIFYYNSKPMGTLGHWHYDTFKVGPGTSGSTGPGGILEDALVTFVLNAQGKAARMEIEGLDVFEHSPEPKEKKE